MHGSEGSSPSDASLLPVPTPGDSLILELDSGPRKEVKASKRAAKAGETPKVNICPHF
jgi:hypothetical protein